MIAHLNLDEQNPAYDLLSNYYDYSNQMKNIINAKRINQITTFLKSLNIKSKRFSEIIKTQNISVIQDFNQAFIHSSEDKIINYETLEFFGDAVLRLAASNFIEKKYPQLSVGERSELRAQIVSDEWLIKLGKKIHIEKLIIKGPKALGDENSKNTIIGEATEALIGSVYKCFNSIQEVNLWLDDIWEEDSEIFLKAPYKFKSKTVLQEWCQSKGFDLPVYKIIEISKKNGDPERFSCDIFIDGIRESSAFGKSHKQAETNAARVLIEKFITTGKI
jgi:ribonuclease-3